MMRRLAICSALILVGIGAACHRAAAPPHLTMQLTTAPAAPPVGRDVTFTLRVRDAAGHPVNGASARLSLEMTFMNMGANVVQLSDRGNGVYSGVGTFPMGGDWDCHAIVRAGGMQSQQVFHYKVG